MSELIKFEVEDESYPLEIIDADGNRWVPSQQVGAALGNKNIRKLIRGLIEVNELIEKRHYCNLTLQKSGRGNPNILALSHRGVIRVSMRSEGTRAKQFRDWAEDVLYEVMTTGRYEHEGFRAEAEIPTLSRDFIAAKEIALATGLVRNDAILAANRAVQNRHGIDCLDLMGVTIDPEVGRQASQPKTMNGRGATRTNLLSLLKTDIKKAAQDGCPFLRTSRTRGLFARRHELSWELQLIGRDKLERFAQSLIDQGHVKRREPDGALI